MRLFIITVVALIVLIVLLVCELAKQSREIDALYINMKKQDTDLRALKRERDDLREKIDNLLHSRRITGEWGGGSKS